MNLKAVAFLGALAVAPFPFSVNAESVATVPEGYVTVTIAGSPDGTSYNQTAVSFPLLAATNLSGQVIGRLTGVTTNGFINSGAGWTPNTMAVPGAPKFIYITSGQNSGRIFQITGNDTTTITVNSQGQNLTTLGFAVTGDGADTYEIIEGDTLLGLFGTTADGIVGGSSSDFSAGRVDKVTINDPTTNVPLIFYFDTSASPPQWRRFGSGANQNNMVISPLAGVHFQRIGTAPLVYRLVGRVPTTGGKIRVATSGASILANAFPVEVTLENLGIHAMEGWRSVDPNTGVSVATSDRVVVKVGSSFLSFYYDKSVTPAQWRRFGSGANQGSVSIPATSAIRLVRSGAVGQWDNWERERPYSLNP